MNRVQPPVMGDVAKYVKLRRSAMEHVQGARCNAAKGVRVMGDVVAYVNFLRHHRISSPEFGMQNGNGSWLMAHGS
jgi:hypothetical protein